MLLAIYVGAQGLQLSVPSCDLLGLPDFFAYDLTHDFLLQGKVVATCKNENREVTITCEGGRLEVPEPCPALAIEDDMNSTDFKELGKGGEGKVVEREIGGRLFAVKVPNTRNNWNDEGMLERIKKLSLLGVLPKIYHAGDVLVMELYDGSLKQMPGDLPLDSWTQLLRDLKKAHHNNLIHGDIHQGQILVKGTTMKLADWDNEYAAFMYSKRTDQFRMATVIRHMHVMGIRACAAQNHQAAFDSILDDLPLIKSDCANWSKLCKELDQIDLSTSS